MATTMQDYSISKCTRKCAISGRGLESGESYYSVIIPDGEDVSRIDISASQWTGPQETAIGWWRCKMPAASVKKTRPAPSGVLLDTLSELLERPGKESLAYLLALLLIRQRVLQEEHRSQRDEIEQGAGDMSSNWCLTCPADGRQWLVPIAVPGAESLATLQDELKGLLFSDE